MDIHHREINGYRLAFTTDMLFLADENNNPVRSVGYVARYSLDYGPNEDPTGFIPYRGEFVKDDQQRPLAFATEVAALDAAIAQVTARLAAPDRATL